MTVDLIRRGGVMFISYVDRAGLLVNRFGFSLLARRHRHSLFTIIVIVSEKVSIFLKRCSFGLEGQNVHW